MSTLTTKAEAMLAIHGALRALIRPCLSKPTHLEIGVIGNADLPVFQLRVHQADMGRIVGKGGVNLTALKALLKAMSTGQGIPTALILTDPEPDRNPRPPHPIWSIEECQKAIAKLLEVAGHPCPVVIVPGRPGQHLVIIGETVPEDISAPLSRWLNPMAVEGATRLLIDDSADAL